MTNKIDGTTLPYEHKGTWTKKIDSKLSPGTQVTWPQFLVELIIINRSKFFDEYKVTKGPGWSNQIGKRVQTLAQQMYTICNYFPHPEKDRLVYKTFLQYFTKNTPLKIGQHRKTRVVVNGSRTKCNITNDEKFVVKGLMSIYEELKRTYQQIQQEDERPVLKDGPTTFRTRKPSMKRHVLDIIEQEENGERKEG